MINLNFVKKKKFLGFFIILLGLTFSQSFAAEIIFDSTTQSYSAGDIVDLTGNIPGGIEGDLVAIEVKSPSGEILLVRTIELGSEGSYSLKFRIPPSGESGTYDIATNVSVEELSETTIQNEFNTKNLKQELTVILDAYERTKFFINYYYLEKKLGGKGTSEKVAELIFNCIN